MAVANLCSGQWESLGADLAAYGNLKHHVSNLQQAPYELKI